MNGRTVTLVQYQPGSRTVRRDDLNSYWKCGSVFLNSISQVATVDERQ